MAKTYEELLEQAAIIRDETAAGKNTAERVGGTITDAVDYVKELKDTYAGIHAEAAEAKKEAAAVKTKNAEQDGKISSLEAKDATHDTKIAKLEERVLQYIYPKIYQLNEGAGAIVFHGFYKGSASVSAERKTASEEGYSYKVVFKSGSFYLQEISPEGVTVLYSSWAEISLPNNESIASSESYAQRDCLYYIYVEGEGCTYYYIDSNGTASEQSATYLLRLLANKNASAIAALQGNDSAQDEKIAGLQSVQNHGARNLSLSGRVLQMKDMYGLAVGDSVTLPDNGNIYEGTAGASSVPVVLAKTFGDTVTATLGAATSARAGVMTIDHVKKISKLEERVMQYLYPKLYQLNEGAGARVFDGFYEGSAGVSPDRKEAATEGYTYKVVFKSGSFYLQEINQDGETVFLYSSWNKIYITPDKYIASSEIYALRDCLYYIYVEGEGSTYYYIDSDGVASEKSATYLLRLLANKNAADIATLQGNDAAQDEKIAKLHERDTALDGKISALEAKDIEHNAAIVRNATVEYYDHSVTDGPSRTNTRATFKFFGADNNQLFMATLLGAGDGYPGLLSLKNKTKLDGYADTFPQNPAASSESNGLMSAEDKRKLDSVASDIQENSASIQKNQSAIAANTQEIARVNSTATRAQETADRAQETADRAQETANTAQTTADSASSAAATAQTAAETAQETAAAAKTKNAEQDGKISSLEAKDATHDTKIAKLEERVLQYLYQKIYQLNEGAGARVFDGFTEENGEGGLNLTKDTYRYSVLYSTTQKQFVLNVTDEASGVTVLYSSWPKISLPNNKSIASSESYALRDCLYYIYVEGEGSTYYHIDSNGVASEKSATYLLRLLANKNSAAIATASTAAQEAKTASETANNLATEAQTTANNAQTKNTDQDARLEKIENIVSHLSAAGRYWNEANGTPTAAGHYGSLDALRSLPEMLGLGRYLVKDDRTRRKLDPNDSTKYADDGTPAALDGSQGQCMWCWNGFYANIWKEGDNLFKVVSFDRPVGNDISIWIPAGGISWLGAGVIDRGEAPYTDKTKWKLCSVISEDERYRGGGGTAVDASKYTKAPSAESPQITMLGMPATNISTTDFGNYARKRGEGWEANWFVARFVVEFLFEVIMGTENSQEAFNNLKDANGLYKGGFGTGVTDMPDWGNYNGSYPVIPTSVGLEAGDGVCLVEYNLPDASGGTYNTYNVPVFFGLVGAGFGNLFQWVRGLIMDAGEEQSLVYVSPSLYAAYDPNIVSDKIMVAECPRVSGWIMRKSYKGLCCMPTAIDGSSTVRYSDQFYTDAETSKGLRVRAAGGSAYKVASAGASCTFANNAATNANADYSAPLCYFAENPVIPDSQSIATNS